MAFRSQGRRPVLFGCAIFLNRGGRRSQASQEELICGVDQMRCENRYSVSSDALREAWSQLGAAPAADTPDAEHIALLDRNAEGRKASGPKETKRPSAVLGISETSEISARQTDTASSLLLTVGAASSFSARESGRSDTHASECSSQAPYWIPDQIKHYFRHRHSQEDDSSGKTDLALREIGLERELPAIDDSSSSRWARLKWCRNPRHALAATLGVMTGLLLALLLVAVVADVHITLPGSRSRAGRLASPGDFPMPIQKRNKQAATPEEINTVRSPEDVEVTSSAGAEEATPNGGNATQMNSAAVVNSAGSSKSGNASCGGPAFRPCSGGPTEFYYNGTRQACMMVTPNGTGLCNRGQNRFTSLENCHQRCVDGGEPAEECYQKAVFAECGARDVVDSWWWYLDGKGCRHWRCVDARGREPPCVAPKGVACDFKQLRFGYIADASPGGSAARRCRKLPSVGGEAKVQHCLVGSNKFPTLEACQRRCVFAQL
ncbi:hypothetical protein MTO96_026286 [Rhipicephalus appendiculatus]